MSVTYEPSLRPENGSEETKSSRLSTWWNGRFGKTFLTEVALISAMFLFYKWVRFLAAGQESGAFSNADFVVSIEQALGIFNEAHLQDALLPFTWLIGLLNRYYIFMHFAGTFLVMFWMYFWKPAHYFRFRRVLILVSALAMVIHIGMPLAPPRLYTSLGFTDTLDQFGPDLYSNDTSAGTANQFAAMPSLHFGYATMVAMGVIGAARSTWRWLILMHPFMTLWAIVVTANHYWLDSIIAGVLVAASVLLFRWFDIATGRQRAPEAANSLF
jgi:hypothetical protein